jgi:hypothetical protein
MKADMELHRAAARATFQVNCRGEAHENGCDETGSGNG